MGCYADPDADALLVDGFRAAGTPGPHTDALGRGRTAPARRERVPDGE